MALGNYQVMAEWFEKEVAGSTRLLKRHEKSRIHFLWLVLTSMMELDNLEQRPGMTKAEGQTCDLK